MRSRNFYEYRLTLSKFDCHHFKKTNDWLVERYGEDSEIDWNLNIDPAVAGV
jgi:uracil-DNA glycosylase